MRSLVTILLILLVVFIALPMVAGPLLAVVKLPVAIVQSVLQSLWIVPRAAFGELKAFGLVGPGGILLVALAVLAVLALRRSGRKPRNNETLGAIDRINETTERDIQETYRRLERMHRRVEALETVLIEQSQKTETPRIRPGREKVSSGV